MPRKADERTAEKIVEDTIEKLISSSIFAEESRINEFNIQQLEQRLNLVHPPQEIEQLASDINAMLDRIEMGYSQLNRFSEDIAHEFRTPLNNLIGQTEILLMNERSPAQYQELLISNLEDYQRLKRMIDSMLFLARADAHKVCLNKQKIQLQSFIEDIFSIFEYQAEEQHCNFVLSLEATELSADPELFGDG